MITTKPKQRLSLNREKFAVWLKHNREALRLTQAELADRANLTQGVICNLENKRENIGIRRLRKIETALGATYHDN